jgi:hypothetical protein
MNVLRRLLGLRSNAEKAARRAFEAEHVGERVSWSTLEADEEDRHVVGLAYGNTRPPQRKYYAVSKATKAVEVILDATRYRPLHDR